MILFVKIFLHQFGRLLNLVGRSFLSLFLESVEKDYQLSFIEATEYSENVASRLYPDFKKTLYRFYSLEDRYRKSVDG